MIKRSRETSSAPSSGEPMATKLLHIANKARKDPKFRFTSLFHLMNRELLGECFEQLRGDAAAGIDRVTKAEYAEKLEANLTDLVDRLHRMAYRRNLSGDSIFRSRAARNNVPWEFRHWRISSFRRGW